MCAHIQKYRYGAYLHKYMYAIIIVEKQSKLSACLLKLKSVDQYAITCDITAYHWSISFPFWVIHK